MTAANPKHLPPEALDAWLGAAATELGLDASVVSIATVLRSAADVAHGVARPAAPLTTFLLGVAVANATVRGEEPAAALEAVAEQIRVLAAGWHADD